MSDIILHENHGRDDPEHGESGNGRRERRINARNEGEWSEAGRKNFRNDSD